MAISQESGLVAKLKMEGITSVPVAALAEYDACVTEGHIYTRAVEQFASGLLTQLKTIISKLSADERRVENQKLRIMIAVLEERTAEVSKTV